MFIEIPGDNQPQNVRLLAAVVAVVPTMSGVEVMLVDGRIPAAPSPPTEPTGATACRLFEDLTGVKARTNPLDGGFVDLFPAVFHDPAEFRPSAAMVYIARLPARTAPKQGAAWVPLSRVEDPRLVELVTEAAARV